MAQTAPQFDWESARPVEEEPQVAAAPPATDDTYPGAPLNDPAAQSPGTVSEVMFDWESARPVEARPEFDLESAQPLRELAKDPAYLMSREQYRAYREETKEDNNEVGEFLSGIPGVIPGLYAMGAGTVGELGQQVAQNWYRPDKLVASLAANANEGVRRQALFYGKLVDYVGQNLRDSDIQRKREAAYGEQIRLRMQQEGKLSGDPVRDHETVMQALFAAKEAGEIPLTDEQLEEDEERAYQDYWRGKAFDQSMANITDVNVAGAPATAPDSRFVGRNMVTGEVVLPGEFSPDVVGMAVDPANILAVGIGSVARVDALRRAGILLGKGLKPTGEVLSATGGAITRGADAITERIQLATGGQRVGDKVVGGLSREAQTYGGAVAAGAVGYVTGGDTIIDQGMTGALALLPSMRLAGATLRRAGATAGAGWVVTNEMAAGPMSAARAETAEKLAGSGAIPERYSRFFRGEGRASADSTLRRVAQDQANPALLRSLAQFGDNVGLTKAVRATDDALGGAIGGAAVTAPFALGASDPEMAGNIVGAGIVLGGAGGLVGGKLTRMSQMQDAMVARMLVDSEASGGNAAAFARAYSHGELNYMAGLQAFTRGKLKFVPLTTSEYRVNLDTKRRGGENTAGFHVEAAADGTQKVFINVGEPSAVAGEVVKIRAVTKGGKTIEVRGADGKSAFTYVPNEAKILVRQGDTVAAGDALTRNTSATLSVPEEIGHAIFSSNVMDGLPRDEMRNYINQRYKTEGVAQRGREYASRLVDQEIAAGVHGAADSINDATRDRLIEDRFTEMSRASLEAGDDALDWARDEIIGATMRAATRGVDLNRLRNQSNFSRLAEQMVASSAQVLRVFGVDVDKMGRVVDPAGIFRDNPVFADPAMRRMVTKYMRDYDQWLAGMEQAGRKDRRGVRVAPSGRAEDLANSPHTVLREVKDANGNGNGVFENDVITRGPDGVVRPKKQADIDRTEVARSAQIKSLWDASKTVPTASTEFGKRRVNGRDVVGGPTLPPQWDLFTQFPQWIREFARQLEAGRTEGRTHVADYNAIGTGASGRYRVTNLGNIEAILREVAFVGWQITKKNHLLATVFDMNAFRAAAKRAIDNGELGEFGNNMDEVNATLLQYLDNHKNGRPGETGIGQTKKNILNGLIGTGTAKQSAANPFYSDLNPRGSVRTFRLDRLNDLRDTGRTGYNFMYEPINANMMPDATPRASRGQAMPDTPANLSTDQILRELEENQGYLGLSTLGMREGRPVKGGAQQTRELLRRNDALNEELRRRGGPQEESDVERVLRQRGQAMPDVEIQQRFPQHRFVSGGQPTMLKTGEPVVLKMHHATRRPKQLMKSGKFDDKYLGETHGAENDFLGWYFSSDYFIGDDGEYVGKRGEVLPFYVRMDNPLVIDTDVYPFIEDRNNAAKVAELRDKGNHDGIIAVITGTSRLGNFEPPAGVKEIYDKAVDLTADKFRDLPAKLQDAVDKEDQIYRDWFEGKRPEDGSEILSLTPNATKLLDSVAPGFSDAVSSVERRRSTGKDGIAAQAWWAIVPPENKGQIKSAAAITRDKSGNVIPLSQRFDQSKPDIRFMPDVADVSSGLPRRSMESRGGAKIDEDGTVTFQGREPKDWAPEDFAKFGKEFGVRNLGPLSKVSNIVDELGRPLAQIPGGLDGKFTYYDLLWLKANPVDVKSLPVELHGKLTAKLARTMTPERGNDVQKFNGILFGMLSPNSPLLPNEFGQARMRFESMDDIRWFASLLPDNPTKEQRKAVNQRLKKELGFTSAKSGGLGIGISVDLSNIVMAAKMFVKKPDFFIKKPNESWANFVDKLTTQVGGLGTKTASFGGVWQDPLMAGISAMDRHMARAFSEELLNNPEIRGRFEGMVVKRFNDLTAKSKKTAQKADAKIRRAKTEKARAKAIKDKQDAMQNLPDPTALKAETLDDVLGQAEIFGADRIKDFVNEAVFAAMGSRKAKYLVKGGAVNPKLPESLQGVEWVEQPKDFQVMSDAYRLALEINAKRAKEIGIEVFPSQWTLWDRIRGRVEPHEAMFPGLEKLPALNDRQLAAAYAANKQAGYARNVKAGQEWKRKSGLSPSSLAYFTPAVLAAGAAASATEEQ